MPRRSNATARTAPPAGGSDANQLLPLSSSTTATPSLPLTQANAVTSLWAGFGTLYRIPSTSSSRLPAHDSATQIVKHIHMSATELTAAKTSSDLRKLHSYLAETAFYVHLAPTLPPASVRVAFLDRARSCMCPHPASGLYTDLVLVLSDLSPKFPVDGDLVSPFSLAHTQAVLTWLARFHAHFWRSPLLDSTPHLWAPTGSYWHLATRSAELARARRQRGDPWAWIVEGAEYWDALLTGQDQRWARLTLVHGDAKAANVLFTEYSGQADLGPACALVDFQYVGPGCGMRDVAYLVATSVDVERVFDGDHAKLVEFGYWLVLSQALGEKTEVPSVQECIDMFEVALLDWCRFMCGWGRWGNVKWVGKTTSAIKSKWEERRRNEWRPSDAEYCK